MKFIKLHDVVTDIEIFIEISAITSVHFSLNPKDNKTVVHHQGVESYFLVKETPSQVLALIFGDPI